MNDGAIRSLIQGDAEAAALAAAGNDSSLAAWCNAIAAPQFWVFKRRVSKDEMTGDVSVDGTAFSWPVFVGRSQGERDAFTAIWDSDGRIDPSRTNVRAGLQDIFSGQAATAQRAHIAAIIRRPATRAEKAVAVGDGSTGAPAITEELTITSDDIARILRS